MTGKVTDRGDQDSSQVRPRVVVVDDETALRDGLPLLLAEAVEVVGVASAIEEFGKPEELDKLSALSPDVVVLDLKLNLDHPGAAPPVIHGRQAIQLLAARGHRVLLYTNEGRRWVLAACLAAGAGGIAHKREPMIRLIDAIRIVAEGGRVVTTEVAGLADMVLRRVDLPNLPPRQLEVLKARARGESYRAIADRLSLAEKTVEKYISAVLATFTEYLQDHSVTDLARELGIDDGDLIN